MWSEKEDLQKIHGKKIFRLEPQINDHTTHSRLESLDYEVSNIKISLLELHDKVSTVTLMLDSFMKEIKEMVVEDVVEEEEWQKRQLWKKRKVGEPRRGRAWTRRGEGEEKEEERVVAPTVLVLEPVDATL